MPVNRTSGRARKLIIALLGFAGAISSAAAPVDVLTLDSSRTPNDFATSAGFAFVRNDLLDPTNFGPTGVHHRGVQSITSVPSITPASLVGIEVVILANLNTPVTAEEDSALSAFLHSGGSLFVAQNEAAALLQPILGVTPGPFGTTGFATVTNAASPLVNGPFGAAGAGSVVATGFSGSFAAGGLTSSGTEALTNDAGIFAASFEVTGGGLVAAFSDEEMFANPGFVGGDAHVGPSSEQMFLNSFAYLMPVPEPTTLMFAAAGAAMLFTRARGRCASRGQNGMPRRS